MISILKRSICIIICSFLVGHLGAEQDNNRVQQIAELKKKIETVTGKERFNTLIKISSLYRDIEPHNSKEYAQLALKVAREIDDQEGISIALYQIGIIHKKLKEYNQALDYFRQYDRLRAEISNQEKLRRLKQLETKAEMVKKDMEVEIQKLKLKNKKLAQNIFLLGLILFIFIILFLARRYLYLFTLWKKEKQD